MAARTKKIGVTVLKVIKPNHFLIQEIPGLNMSQSAQKFLELESNYLNQFDLLDVIPKVFQYPIKGSVVLVKTEEDAVWYRGKVITVLETSKGARVSIFLVDYGRIVAVSKEWIRKIPNEYLDVPFQALDFVLPNIQPSSLIFDDELILHRGPSEKWDTAATEEIRRIVKVGITGEAFVDHEDVNGVYYGKLQINSGGEKMCLNQYLLDRNFACHLNLGQNIDTGSRIKKVSDKILFWEDSREINSLSPHQPSSSITGRTSRASRGRATPVVKHATTSDCCFSCSSSSTLSMTFSSQESDSTVRGESPKRKQNRRHQPMSQTQTLDMNFSLLHETRSESTTCEIEPQELSPASSHTSHKKETISKNFKERSDTGNVFSSINSLVGKGRGKTILNNILTLKQRSSVGLGGSGDVPTITEGIPSGNNYSHKEKNVSSNVDNGVAPIELNSFANSPGKSESRLNLLTTQTLGATSTPIHSPKPPQNHFKAGGCDQYQGARPKSKNSFYHTLPTFVTPILKANSVSPKGSNPTTCVQNIENRTGHSLSPISCDKVETRKSSWNALEVTSKESKLINKSASSIEGEDFSSSSPKSSKIKRFEARITSNLFNSIETKSSKHLYGNPSSIVLHFGSHIPKPVKSINAVPLAEPIKECLTELGFPAPSTIQSHVWPVALRCRNVAAIAPMHSGKSLACIVPLLSLLLHPEDYEMLKRCPGPLALILCSSWQGCQDLYSQCLLFVPEHFHEKIQCIYGGSGIKNQEFSLVGGCDLLITTPACYLHMNKIIKMERCCHVMLDDGEILIESFLDEVVEILKDYSDLCTKRPAGCSLPSQIMLCSSQCSPGVKSFISHIMQDPIVFVSSFMEAAIYAQVPVYPVFSPKGRLLDTAAELLLSGKKQRTVVCTTNAEVAEKVAEIFNLHSVHTLTVHENLEHFDMKAIWSEWEDFLCDAVLVVSDYVLPELDITKADWLIHYDLPELSRLMFGNRFRCLLNNLQAKIDPNDNPCTKAGDSLCHILLTEDCLKQSVDLIRFLNRVNTESPNKLQLLGVKKQLSKELCPKIKAFGSCRLQNWCNYRHTLKEGLDQPSLELPHWGEATVHITHILDASHFYGHLLEHRDPTDGSLVKIKREKYVDLHVNLSLHYSTPSNKIEHSNVAVGEICCVLKPGGTYHRVQVSALHIPNNLVMLKKASVFFLDEGWTETVELSLLMKMPEEFLSVPFQAIEIYACRLQPVDGHQQWTPQASSRVHEQIFGKNLTGKVVMSLKNTIFLDPIVLRKEVLKSTYMHTFNLSLELLKDGFATPNAGHLIKLKEACCDKIAIRTEPAADSQDSEKNLIFSPEIGFNNKHEPVNKAEISITDRFVTPASENNSQCQKSLGTLGTELESSQGNQSPVINGLSLLEPKYETCNPAETHPVYVLAVDTPHLFYIQKVKSHDKLLKQNDEINTLVQDMKLEAVKQPKIGTICVALFDDGNRNWFRAQVKKVFPLEANSESWHDEFDMFFLDFGDICRVKRKNMYEITSQLLELPFQAIECSLFGICAVEEDWTDKVSEEFLNLTRDEDNYFKEFNLKVVEQSPIESRAKKYHYVVKMWQPQSESLASQLINLGLACKINKAATHLNETSENEADCESSAVSLTPEPDEEEKKAFYSLVLRNLVAGDTHPMTETSDDESTLARPEKPHKKNSVNNLPMTSNGVAMQKKEQVINKTSKSTPAVPSKIVELYSVLDKDMPNLEVVYNYTDRRRPSVQWYQTTKEVFVIVLVPCCQEYEFFATTSSINLRLLRGDHFFQLNEELYGEIVLEDSRSVAHEMNVRFKLSKLVAKKWPRLIKSDKKAKHITFHHDHLETTSCDETVIEERPVEDSPVAASIRRTHHFDPCNMDDFTCSGDDSDRTWRDSIADRGDII